VQLELGSQLFANKLHQLCVGRAPAGRVFVSDFLPHLFLVVSKGRVLQIVLDHGEYSPELGDAVSELNPFLHRQERHIGAFANIVQAAQMHGPYDILLHLGLLEKNVFYCLWVSVLPLQIGLEQGLRLSEFS